MKSTFSVHLLLLLRSGNLAGCFEFPNATPPKICLQFARGLATPTPESSSRIGLHGRQNCVFKFQGEVKFESLHLPLPPGREIRSGSAGSCARTMRTDCGNDGSQRSSYCDNTRSCCIGRHAVGRNFVAAVRKVRNRSAAVVIPRPPSPRTRNVIKAYRIETSGEERDSPCTARSVDNDFAHMS